MPELRGKGFQARRDQPLIGILVQEGDQELVRYFTHEDEVDASTEPGGQVRALSLFGAWADLDWEAALDELDRIRQSSPPAPPLRL